MQATFTSDFYSQNRQRIMEGLPKGSLVVLGGAGLVQRTADTTFPFVQHSSFWYLTDRREEAFKHKTKHRSGCWWPIGFRHFSAAKASTPAFDLTCYKSNNSSRYKRSRRANLRPERFVH